MSYNRRPFNHKFPVKCFHSSRHPKSNFAPASSNNNPSYTSTTSAPTAPTAPTTTSTTVAAAASATITTTTITSSMPASSTLLADSAETKPNTQQRWMEWDQYCQEWVEYVCKGQNTSNDQANFLSIDSIHSNPAIPSGASGGGGGGGGDGGGGISDAISENVDAQSLNSDIKSISTGKIRSNLNGSVKPLHGFKQCDENTSKNVSTNNTSNATTSKVNRDHHASTQPVNKNEKSHQSKFFVQLYST